METKIKIYLFTSLILSRIMETKIYVFTIYWQIGLSKGWFTPLEIKTKARCQTQIAQLQAGFCCSYFLTFFT